MHTFSGPLSVGMACSLLPNHRTFIECEVGSSCVAGVKPQLILIFARQSLSRESDIDDDEYVYTSAKVYLKSLNEIEM